MVTNNGVVIKSKAVNTAVMVGSWMNDINFHLFSLSLKVPPWESIMEAVIRIAGMSTVTLVILIFKPVLVTII